MSSEEPKSMLGAALAAIQASVSSVANRLNEDGEDEKKDKDRSTAPPDAAVASTTVPPTRKSRRNSAKRDAAELSSKQAVGSGDVNKRSLKLDAPKSDEGPPPSTTESAGKRGDDDTRERTDDAPKLDSTTTGSSFPVSLRDFVAEGMESTPQFTSWDEEDLSFYLVESSTHPKWKELMKKHFGHDDSATLNRQLRAYGFRRSRSKKPGQSLWYHNHFTRDSVDFSAITVRGKYVEISTLPLAMDDNGDIVGTLPRKVAPTSTLDPSLSSTETERFPVQIHRFVTAIMTSKPTMISFADDDKTIRVREDHPDLAIVLKENFGNSSIGFFTQNLLAYGWKRDSDPLLRTLYFSHPHFHRDESKCDFSKIIPKVRQDALKPSSLGPSPSSAAGEWEKHSSMATDDPSLEDGSPPEPKFRVHQTVYARDTDGVMYESVIRRRLYGQSRQKQVQLGLVASEHEAEELLSRDEAPTWHYFVHYNKWNVNWDRWVPESNVYEATDRIKAYADRLLGAHRSIRSELTRKVKGKKGFQTVEGSEFLQRWRIARAKIDEEMRPDGDPPQDTSMEMSTLNEQASSSTVKKAEANPWSSKAALSNELKLRERSLTSTGSGAGGHSQQQLQLTLPFALKKSLVESWEVITQCGMVLELPAPVTVRQALDKYLESKGVVSNQEEGKSAAPGANEADSDSVAAAPTDSDSVAATENREALNQQQNDWRDMADGIALLFDEALPERLLYREEWPQFHVLCDHPEYSLRRFSDVYGCEHLLRLFVRLPDLVSDGMCESDARPVLAKVNDLARFLHKNQGTLFAQPYRKPTDAETKERGRLIRKEEARRKRQLESAQTSEDDDYTGTKRLKSSSLVEGVEVIMH